MNVTSQLTDDVPTLRDRFAALVARVGIGEACERVGIVPNTGKRILNGKPVHRVTERAVEATLDRIERSAA